MKLSGKTYYTTIVKNLRKIVKCGICGHKTKIQFHHIKPTNLSGMSRGSSRRAYDVVKHPDCYIPLCYFCHQKVTLNEWEIGTAYFGEVEDVRLAVWKDVGVVERINVI